MISIDLSREAVARREAEIDRRTSGSTATGAARHAERRRVLAEVEAEEQAQTKVAADRAEAAAERARIASVVRLGRDQGRGRQALRVALLTPISAEAARGLIGTMSHDAVAQPEALVVPGFVAFGGEAAQQERRRIISAFAHPAAQGRFASTVALALEGSEALTAAQIAPVLAGLPLEPAPVDPAARLAQIAEARAEFGSDAQPRRTPKEAISEGWRKAAAQANASIGAAPAVPAGGPVILDLAGPGDPAFGSQADLDRALTAARAGLGRS